MKIGYLHWLVWAAVSVTFVCGSFGVLETLAWTDGKTLSRSVYDLSQAWPLSTFMLGHVTGGLTFGLAVHFFWHWNPADQNDHRG